MIITFESQRTHLEYLSDSRANGSVRGFSSFSFPQGELNQKLEIRHTRRSAAFPPRTSCLYRPISPSPTPFQLDVHHAGDTKEKRSHVCFHAVGGHTHTQLRHLAVPSLTVFSPRWKRQRSCIKKEKMKSHIYAGNRP